MAWVAGHRWAEFDFKAKITGLPATFGIPPWGVDGFGAIIVMRLIRGVVVMINGDAAANR